MIKSQDWSVGEHTSQRTEGLLASSQGCCLGSVPEPQGSWGLGATVGPPFMPMMPGLLSAPLGGFLMEKLLLLHLQFATNQTARAGPIWGPTAPGKGWGLPVSGDIFPLRCLDSFMKEQLKSLFVTSVFS